MTDKLTKKQQATWDILNDAEKWRKEKILDELANLIRIEIDSKILTDLAGIASAKKRIQK